MTFDLIIKNGTILDGTGAPAFTGDIGISGERITAVGDLELSEAEKVFDAAGKTVTPGFIDVHTHCDRTFQDKGMARYLENNPESWKGNHQYMVQGVTTVVTGNCGFGFTDADEWFEKVREMPFGSNVAHLTPHGMIRMDLFGPDQPERLDRIQRQKMADWVTREMEKGVVGISFGLEYAPGLLADKEEMVEAAKAAAKAGGVMTVHMRDETGVAREGRPGVLGAIREVLDVARRAEIPLQISHLKIVSPFGDVRPDDLFETIESAQDEGLDVTVDQYPYDAGSSPVTYLIPHRFKTGFGVKEEYKTGRGLKELTDAVDGTFGDLPPEKILIVMYPQKVEYEGLTVADISGRENRSPAESLADMLIAPESPMGVFFHQSMDVVRAIMPKSWVITGSDSRTVPFGHTKVHPRGYGAFSRKIKICREEGLLDPAMVIRSMTSLPAEKFGLKDRGRIEKGFAADIAVLDWEKVEDKATYQDPHQYAEGLDFLLMSGKPVVENGRPTGQRMGKVLHR